MGSRRVAISAAQAVDISAGAQSHAAPTDTTGGLDISSWKSGIYSADACVFRLEPSVGGPVAITAGAYVVGSIGSALYRIADLNAGAAIALTTTIGFAQRLVDVGAFDKLWLVDTGSAFTHVYGATPLESLD